MKVVALNRRSHILFALCIKFISQHRALQIPRLLCVSQTWRPDDSTQLAVIKPSEFAMHTGIQNDAAGSIVRMGIHFFHARWAIGRDVKLLWVDRLGPIIRTLVGASHLIGEHTKGRIIDDVATAVFAKADLHYAVDCSNFQINRALWTAELSFVSRRGDRFDRLIDRSWERELIAGLAVMM